jgi:hypothetical protein
MWRAFRAAPFPAQLLISTVVLVTLWSASNWLYHVARKPTELYFPVSDVLYKYPVETWRKYEPIFRAHATATITPEFLAALAQVEASGNPLVRTYWEWSASWNPFELYRPASSAVGMYQITDGTFIEAKRYCIRDNRVIDDGPWHDVRSCWFNGLYTRVIPTHAVEMTSALLDRQVANILARRRMTQAMLWQKQDLAAVIHLCGAGAGDTYAKRGFRLTSGQRCGDHDVRSYLARIHASRSEFLRLGAERADLKHPR